ncbi:SusC/RagA family TonB-linked outer membrane protein [Butyricimonas sp. NSJ-56]|uniref:SusC/RagA family TonB-linked outer membrane protein n=2 Tax=Butyricimonas hominis TaxID=2763032 RepID=A0ABR7CW15_9BACT|nr:SusC/RagA family TonB-linked outer membrane protein [Butyricimonas hominis]
MKIFLSKMKFSLLFLMLFCSYTEVFSQKVTLEVKNMDLYTVLLQLKNQTGVRILYDADYTKQIKCEDTNFVEKELTDVLSQLLAKTSLVYKEVNGTFVISKAPEKENKTVKLTGTVKDVQGVPLPGVTVVIKGTAIGVSTDAQGGFTLNVKEQERITLVFSFVGMKTKEAVATPNKAMTITLEEDTQTIDEVVITGYQVVDKRKNTSAITSVKAADIMRPGVTSIDQMLEGQIPDLVSMTNSGEIGVAPKLRIRGTSTLIGNREPLWVIDGIVQQDPVNISPEELNNPDYINRIGNAISGLNPQDIERIDVLKDASATALYGTKAANGVIVITTKRGHLGAPMVSYNMTGTLKFRPRYSDRHIDVMTSKERVQFSRDLLNSNYNFSNRVSLVGYEYLYAQLYAKQISYDEFVKQVSDLESLNTDWFSVLGNDAFSSQHTVSLSGGSELIRYYASIGYTDDNDVIEFNRNDRYTAKLNLDIHFSDRVSLSLGIDGNKSTRKYYQNDLAPIDYAYNTSRAIPFRNEDGTLFYYKKYSGSNLYKFNILNELENSGCSQEGSSLQFQANLLYNPLSWLKLNGIFAYSISNTDITSYWGAETFYAAQLRHGELGEEFDAAESELPAGGELKQQTTRNENYTIRFQLDANKYFGQEEQHNINASFGFEASSSKYVGTDIINRGYYPDRGMQFATFNQGDYPKFDAWLLNNRPTLTDNLTNLVAAYASISYSYQNWITLNANARYDGSNRFGSQSNDKLLPVWSASLSYNPLEQFQVTDFFDFLHLKFSYGYQGNMQDGQSPEMIIKKLPMDEYYHELLSEVSIYPNPNLKWERTSSLNAGIEFSILNRRLMVSSDFYHKKTKDAFLSKKISGVNGIDSYTVNSGEVLNRGYNVSLTGVPVQTQDFRWSLSTSISKTFNRVETKPSTDEFNVDHFLDGTVITKGNPVNTFFSYRFKGLSPLDGGPLFYDYKENPERLYGKSKHDIFTTILEASGSREPKFSGSFNNTFTYKNFRLNMTLAYSLGAKTRLFKLFDNQDFGPEQNVNRDFLDRWQRPGDEMYTDIPVIMNGGVSGYDVHWSSYGDLLPTFGGSAWNMYNYSDLRVVSADYLKCTTMTLTYSFPNELISKWKLQRLELSLSTNNPFIFCSSKLKGQTPTQGGFTTIQLSERPTFSFGLYVSF